MPADTAAEASLAILRSKRVQDFVASAISAAQGDPGWDAADALDAVNALPAQQMLATRALCAVVSDLVRQGWSVKVHGRRISFERPQPLQGDVAGEKARLRAQKLAERDEQLRASSVRDFVKSMERRRLHRGKFVSVFSLMRDGRELAAALGDRWRKSASSLPIQPYLQFVEGESCDEHTGLRLVDIWRYFRHTWTTAYKSVPGRSIYILVRDAAAAFHPVIGIAALASPTVQIKVRDDRIGWSTSGVLTDLRTRPTKRLAEWLQRSLDDAIENIFRHDLLESGLLVVDDLCRPRTAALAALRVEADRCRREHEASVVPSEKKQSANPEGAETDWEAEARSPLFRGKRCLLLGDLLAARLALRKYVESPSAAGLRALLSTTEGVRAVERIVRKVRGDRVGVAMADISVCGAIAPYSSVLGGKLVCALLLSPEVRTEYARKYGGAESIIASSMAGRPVRRKAELVYLGTTSLYRVSASQYNRIAIPCGAVGGRRDEVIRYERLGETEGFGSSHFGDSAVVALGEFLEKGLNQKRVNHIFGEGASPRMRLLRDGLDALGLPSNELIRHGSSRLVYGVPLIRNLRGYLLGFELQPRYLIPSSRPKERTTSLARWWTDRWLAMRVQSSSVLEQVAEHRCTYPVQHGARVPLPPERDGQETLFDTW